MKKIFIFIFMLFVAIGNTTYASSAKETCGILKPQINSIQEQLPIQMDYLTTLIGVNVTYMPRACILYYIYEVKAEKIIEDLLNEYEMTKREAFDWLRSSEGKLFMKEIFTEQARLYLSSLNSPNDLKIKILYKFDELSIPPVLILGLDTTK